MSARVRTIHRKLRHSEPGLNLAGDISAVLAVNTDGGVTGMTTQQRVTVEQRSGRQGRPDAGPTAQDPASPKAPGPTDPKEEA